MSRKPIIAGNWKLNKTIAEAKELIEDIKVKLLDNSTDSMPITVVCPVFTALSAVNEIVKNSNIALGAQNCYCKDSGAFTGEVSLPMLQEVGVQYVIIGHSERREYFSESDEMVNCKAKAILEKGLIPIICCGESLEQREAGVTDSHIEAQIRKALDGISSEDVAKSVIAYEPIWAIGTGKTCDSIEANRVIKMIRDVVADIAGQASADSLRILYGGSVKPDSIEEQMSQSDIDGALVGGASIVAESFIGIVEGCMKVKA